MNIRRLVQAASITGVAVFMMTASAVTINFNTVAGSGFNDTTVKTLNSTSGEAATLIYVANSGNLSDIPTNANFGSFDLTCLTCTPKDSVNAKFAGFQPFTFNLFITDVTDGAVGKMVGTSEFVPANEIPGKVYLNVSPIRINWSPLVLGPGTTGAVSGNFGPTKFITFNPTLIVGPLSGTIAGTTTIQGFVDSAAVNPIPEPATLGLVGGTLLGLGLLGRKKRSN